MRTSLSTRSALLLALRRGPGYGSELIRRLHALAGSRVHLSESRVYPVLKEMEDEGLVHARRVVPKGSRGARVRIYYDLSPRGIVRSGQEREALARLLETDRTPQVPAHEQENMVLRLMEMDEISEFGEELRSAMKKRGR